MSVATPVGQARQVRQPLVVAATLVCAASMLGLGLWAFLDPTSFSGFVDFAPYNEHLIHDAGAFQLGIGAALLVALWWPDGLVVALTGFAVASGLHTVSHAIDRHLGGHDGDVPSLGLLTLVALAAITARIRRRTS
jgi:MYXO-CTERM domain-containing protein